ncbi:MAG: ABC transporter permease [Acidobacteria bacterium]|nr:ABC transporter permease [Acidobacteriota bacterium]
MINFGHDIKFGIRMLRKSPGFTLVSVLTLALAIGATTAIFSIINTVLLKPLSFHDSERIMSLWELLPDGEQERFRVAPGNFYDWRERSGSFEKMAAFGSSGMTLTGAGDPEQLRGAVISTGYFDVLGAKPIIGRTFLTEEHTPGKDRVIVLSQAVWQSRFNADPKIGGRQVTLDHNSYTVVGVMPPGLYPTWPSTTGTFSFGHRHQQYWVPLTESAEGRNNRRSHVFGVIGRLKDDTSLEQAQAEMREIAGKLALEHPRFNAGESAIVNQFRDEIAGDIRPTLWMLLGAVGLVLLIACANIAGLLLARFADRHREIAIRAALGAGRWTLIRQFLIEGVIIALIGGAMGIWIAVFGLDGLLLLLPQQIPQLSEISIDLTVMGFALLLSVATGLLFGIIPAWQASQTRMQQGLKDCGRGSSLGSHHRFRSFLVASQISLAVVLVIGAILLAKSFQQLLHVDPGFDYGRTMVAEIEISSIRYAQRQQVTDFYSRLVDKVRALPGVKSVALAYDHPLEANWIDSFSIEGRESPGSGEQLSAWLGIASEGYFQSMGIGMLMGREFTSQDNAGHPGAMVVNQAFASRFFRDQNPLGKRIRLGTPSAFWGDEVPSSFEIVGVARDVKFLGLQSASEPAYYIPAKQFPQNSMDLIVRTAGDPVDLISVLRKVVLAVDPDQPIAAVSTLDSLMSEQVAQQRFNMFLIGLFGITALLLATIGIFSLVSYQVTARTDELGIRIALGARRNDIMVLIIRHGLILAITGVVIGLAGALALGRWFQSLLYGVSATDPVIYSTVALFLGATAIVACLIPARRATRVDPMIALRNQ